MSTLAKNIAFARRFVTGLHKMNDFNRVAGECRVISVEEGRVKAEVELTERHVNSFGRLHGGCTSTLCDIFTSAALVATERGHPGVTVDLYVTCAAAAKVGETIVIDSQVVKSGRMMGFTRAEITRKGDNTPIGLCLHSKAFPEIEKNI